MVQYDFNTWISSFALEQHGNGGIFGDESTMGFDGICNGAERSKKIWMRLMEIGSRERPCEAKKFLLLPTLSITYDVCIIIRYRQERLLLDRQYAELKGMHGMGKAWDTTVR